MAIGSGQPTGGGQAPGRGVRGSWWLTIRLERPYEQQLQRADSLESLASPGGRQCVRLRDEDGGIQLLSASALRDYPLGLEQAVTMPRSILSKIKWWKGYSEYQ